MVCDGWFYGFTVLWFVVDGFVVLSAEALAQAGFVVLWFVVDGFVVDRISKIQIEDAEAAFFAHFHNAIFFNDGRQCQSKSGGRSGDGGV